MPKMHQNTLGSRALAAYALPQTAYSRNWGLLLRGGKEKGLLLRGMAGRRGIE